MARSELDRRLSSILRAQHGVITRAQALAVGLSPSNIDKRVANGRWLRLGRGVYALPSSPSTWLQKALAATLSTPGSVLAAESAAALHGLDGVERGPLVLTAPRVRGRRSSLAVVRHSDLIDRALVRGIPVQRVPVALLELCARHPWLVERPLDDALVTKRTNLTELTTLLDRVSRGRYPGARMLRSLIVERADGHAPPESLLEARLHQLLRATPGLPRWHDQRAPPWWPGGASRVDVTIPAFRLIIEADGRRWHTRVGAFEEDRRRDLLAFQHGWRVVRVTWRMITDEPGLLRDALCGAAEIEPVLTSFG